MNRSPWRLEEVDGSLWRLEEVDGGDEQYPVESRFAVRHTPPDEQDPRFDRSAPTQVRFLRFAVRHTPPDEQDPRFDRSAPTQVHFLCFAVRHTPTDQQDPRFDRRRSVSSVLRYARPLPMNRIPFQTWPVEHKAVSSVLRYAGPRFHWLFHPSPPDEHDDAFRSDPAGWLPMNTTTTQFLRSDPAMYTSPGRTYARVGIRDPTRMYIRGRIFFLAHWPLYVRVYATCTPLLRHVRASTSTSMYVHVRDQNDNATYASSRWVPTVRHFLACEDVAGGSQQSGGQIVIFLPGRTSLRAKM